jgi:RimJ/RimL family protein N-acetyltransferase
MPEPTILTTGRLTLRLFQASDAAAVQLLAGDRAIADTTLNIPHPYLDGMAERWIDSHEGLWREGRSAIFAVERHEDSRLVGATGLTLNPVHERAELGYWIGRPFWGCGYGTEAARAVVAFGFRTLGLSRIHASYLTRNPASGRIMEKIGMRPEGILRRHVRKWDLFEDLAVYGILREEFEHTGSMAGSKDA